MIKEHYFSYLLRIWQPENMASRECFASLEDPKSRQVVYFKSLEELFVYLGALPTTGKNMIPAEFLKRKPGPGSDF